jgi:hypothetical protein
MPPSQASSLWSYITVFDALSSTKNISRVLLSWCGEESDVEFSWDGLLIRDEDEEAMDDSD